MKILICTDGSSQAENAIRFGGLIAAGCRAETTLLGISESAAEEQATLDALRRGQLLLKGLNVEAELITKTGRPVVEIVKRTRDTKYDLVVIGATRKEGRGPFLMSARAYKIIEAVEPAVLVVMGKRESLKRVLLCSGGSKSISKAVDFAGQIANAVLAAVTILHVMPEPPAIYTDLIRKEEDVNLLLESNSALGRNLRREKETLERSGVSCEVHLRHGLVIPAIFKEIQEGDYDLIVAGSYPTRDPLRTYIIGNVTREIVNRADCPVLVVRTREPLEGFIRSVRSLLAEINRPYVRPTQNGR